MVKVTAKMHDKFETLFISVKKILAIKVVDGQTVIFMKSNGLTRNSSLIVKESPHDIGMSWISYLVDEGKEIGLSGVF